MARGAAKLRFAERRSQTEFGNESNERIREAWPPSPCQPPSPSGRFVQQLLQRGADLGQLRDAVLLVDLVETDAGHVLAEQDARPNKQVIEVGVDDAAEQV